MAFTIIREDLARVRADAIVVPANKYLTMTGGTGLAVAKAAGYRRLTRACKRLGGCPVGQAVATPAYRLPAEHIIHAVGPIWRGGDHDEARILRSAYDNSHGLALRLNAQSVALPLLSAGTFGYPIREAFEIAVEAKDDRTLVFELAAPCAYMEDLMAFPTFFPVKQSAVEAYADWQTSPGGWCQEAGFVSNGAYVCTGWNHDVSMTYEKNPYWYDAENVTVEKLEYMLSADDTAIYAAYNAGDLDFADSVPTDEVASLLDNPEFHIVDELGTYYVAFNAKSKIFEGKTPEQAACMREAFTIMIDRDYICENIGQTGQVAANAFIPLGMADGNGGIFKSSATEQGYFDAYAINNDYDAVVEKARTLLKAAGYQFDDNGKLSAETPIQLEYLTNTTSGHIKIAETIQQDLSALGIELSIQQQDWNVFLEERKAGNFDFAREGWIADFNDPINMLEMWTTVSGNNDCQFGR